MSALVLTYNKIQKFCKKWKIMGKYTGAKKMTKIYIYQNIDIDNIYKVIPKYVAESN